MGREAGGDGKRRNERVLVRAGSIQRGKRILGTPLRQQEEQRESWFRREYPEGQKNLGDTLVGIVARESVKGARDVPRFSCRVR